MSKYPTAPRGWCSPERYIQGPDVFQHIKSYTDKLGKQVVAFIDQLLFESISQRLDQIYMGAPRVHTVPFAGEVTMELIEQQTEVLRPLAPDVVLGIGGGKTIDVAKAVSYRLGIRFIVVPTIASTDAPTSSLSVLYRADGSHEGEFFYDHSPSIVLVDSRMIAEAPTRFLVSGMGDALATLIEAEATRKSETPNLVYHTDGGSRQTLAGRAIAKACYEALMQYGVLAKIACEGNVVTEALEHIIETNTLLSGLGFENSATAGAHSINDGLTAIPAASQMMHGERVAFGCIVQLVIESAPAEQLDEVIGFCLAVGLPVCLADLQVEAKDDNIGRIAQASMDSCWGNMPFHVSVEQVAAAIKTADAYATAFKNRGNA